MDQTSTPGIHPCFIIPSLHFPSFPSLQVSPPLFFVILLLFFHCVFPLGAYLLWPRVGISPGQRFWNTPFAFAAFQLIPWRFLLGRVHSIYFLSASFRWAHYKLVFDIFFYLSACLYFHLSFIPSFFTPRSYSPFSIFPPFYIFPHHLFSYFIFIISLRFIPHHHLTICNYSHTYNIHYISPYFYQITYPIPPFTLPSLFPWLHPSLHPSIHPHTTPFLLYIAILLHTPVYRYNLCPYYTHTSHLIL